MHKNHFLNSQSLKILDKAKSLALANEEKNIANEILKETVKKVDFLLDVGLDYLSLNRTAKTLSGGESQRIRLATQIGSKLTGVLYVLDEPSIGLHARDNEKLINTFGPVKKGWVWKKKETKKRPPRRLFSSPKLTATQVITKIKFKLMSKSAA